MYKKTFMLFIGALLLCLAGCSDTQRNSQILVGTIAGPETELVETAVNLVEKKEGEKGTKIKIIEFTDYALPNTALNDGSIDVNIFQHQPYLDETIKNKHYQLAVIGKTFVYPMGIYSQKLKAIKDVPVGAKVAIPNDPSNEARALLLLEKSGLIVLKKGTETRATVLDIEQNPKKLDIKELDAAQLPRALNDVDLAAINSNYTVPAGLSPAKDAIFLENMRSPYANLIVVRKGDEHNPKFLPLVNALHSKEVQEKAKELFQHSAIPAWEMN